MRRKTAELPLPRIGYAGTNEVSPLLDPSLGATERVRRASEVLAEVLAEALGATIHPVSRLITAAKRFGAPREERRQQGRTRQE